MKGKDGKYHIGGASYRKNIGSRAEVMHGTALKTSGGLSKSQLKYNKHGKIVSRAKSSKGKQMLKRLISKGYHTRKGHFGYVKGTKSVHATRKRSHRSRKRRSKRRRSRSRSRKRRRRNRRRVIKGVNWEDRLRKSGRFTTKPSYQR